MPERNWITVALVALLLSPLAAHAQEDPEPFRDHGRWPEKRDRGTEPKKAPEPLKAPKINIPDKDLSEPLLEDEKDEAVPPALVRADAGIILWPFLRTSVRISREGGSRGTRIDSAEEKGGLAERAISPFVDFTIGRSVRFGVTAFDLRRSGEYTRVDEPIVAGGLLIADENEHLDIDLAFTQADAYVQWDILAGQKYRIGVLGGARITRVTSTLRGIRANPIALTKIKVDDILWSPFFGGHLEFAPVPIFTFYANIRFIDWSWHAIGLSEQRTYEMRLGFRALLVPEIGLTAAFEFRFLSAFIDPFDLNGGHNFSRYQLDAGGLALVLGLQY